MNIMLMLGRCSRPALGLNSLDSSLLEMIFCDSFYHLLEDSPLGLLLL
jgi:hypothetical protein